jgi:hypothetical protein
MELADDTIILLLFNAVTLFVPPDEMGSAVPDKDRESVPDVVIGDPVTERNAGVVRATDVTVPPDVGVCQVAAPPTLVAVNT